MCECIVEEEIVEIVESEETFQNDIEIEIGERDTLNVAQSNTSHQIRRNRAFHW